MSEKYQVIYADPPWNYFDKARAGKRGAEFKYPCMKTKDICSLPVENLADTNCFLFLWATMPNLPEAFKVIDAWGFKYKTCAFTWIKMNKKKTDTVFWGGGHYTRCLEGNTEVYILVENSEIKIEKIKNLSNYDFNKIKIWGPYGWRKIYDFVENKDSVVHSVRTNIGNLVLTGNHKMIYKLPIGKKEATTATNRKHKDARKTIVCHEIVEKTFDEFVLDHNRSLVKNRDYSINLLFSERPIESPNPIHEICGIALSEDIAWMIGLFCAEGSYGSNENCAMLCWHLHKKEKHFYERVKNVVDKLHLKKDRHFNIDLKVNWYEYENRAIIQFASKKIESLIKHFVHGNTSKSKRLNIDLLLQTTPGFRRSFIEGMFDGDGCDTNPHQKKMFLCNAPLIEDFKKLMHSTGIPSSLYMENKPQEKNGTLCYSYGISFYRKNRNLDLKIKDTKVRTVTTKSINKNCGIADTYDISVEDELFIANDTIVHNSNTELCLLATRGKPKRISASVHSVVMTPIQKHSRKPDEVRQRIVSLVGDVPRIELFARETAPGWSALGNEIDGIDLRESLVI